MIVQQLLARKPDIAGAVVLAQTSPAFGKPDGDWQKELSARGSARSIAVKAWFRWRRHLVRELVGDDPDAGGMALARDCMAAVPEATYRTTMLALMGFDLRGALKDIAVRRWCCRAPGTGTHRHR